LRGQRLLGHAAKALDTHEAVRLDLADDEAELAHMGEEPADNAFPACS